MTIGAPPRRLHAFGIAFCEVRLAWGFYWIVEVWLRHLCRPANPKGAPRRKAFALDVAYLIAGFVLLYGGLWFAADRTSVLCQLPRPTPGAILLRAFFVPDMIWTYSIGWVDLVQHTHPRSAWFKDRSEWGFYKANVQSTTHVLVPFQMDFSMHHILRHTAHHIDPRIPLYALEPAQRQIEQAHGKDVIVANLSRGYVLGLLKICRLYDYDQHCWLDYDGSPTSVPARHYHEVDRSISPTCLQE